MEKHCISLEEQEKKNTLKEFKEKKKKKNKF